jgi:hypothetical protein
MERGDAASSASLSIQPETFTLPHQVPVEDDQSPTSEHSSPSQNALNYTLQKIPKFKGILKRSSSQRSCDENKSSEELDSSANAQSPDSQKSPKGTRHAKFNLNPAYLTPPSERRKKLQAYKQHKKSSALEVEPTYLVEKFQIDATQIFIEGNKNKKRKEEIVDSLGKSLRKYYTEFNLINHRNAEFLDPHIKSVALKTYENFLLIQNQKIKQKSLCIIL